jgi:hypothetical protein
MLPNSEGKLDRTALHRCLLEEIQGTEAIHVRLLAAKETPTVLHARQLYSEQLTRLQVALNSFPPL